MSGSLVSGAVGYGLPQPRRLPRHPKRGWGVFDPYFEESQVRTSLKTSIFSPLAMSAPMTHPGPFRWHRGLCGTRFAMHSLASGRRESQSAG
jgi:hypothetical protein